MSGLHPYTHHLTASAPGVAAGTDQTIILGESPEAGVVAEVSLIPSGQIGASASLYRTWTVFNRGTTGVGTVQVATTDTAVSGINDNDERLFTLSAPGNLVVAAGDVLELVETHASTGTAHSGYRVDLSISRT